MTQFGKFLANERFSIKTGGLIALRNVNSNVNSDIKSIFLRFIFMFPNPTSIVNLEMLV